MRNKLQYTIIVSMLAFLASCSSIESNKSHFVDGSYKYATELSCKSRNPNNIKYCSCFSEVMNKISPHKIKSMANDPSKTSEVTKEIIQIMISNSRQLNECDKYKIISKTIPKVEVTGLAKEVINHNKDKILTPELLDDFEPLNENIGYEFAMHKKGADTSRAAKYKLTKIEQNKYFFDYVYSDGRVLKEKYYWEKGFNYIQIEKDGKYIYKIRTGLEKCKFVLGACSFKTSFGRVQHVYTEFRDGIWFISYQRFGKKIVDLNIYEVNGFPLYEYHYVMGNKTHLETVRIDKF
ncbi:hypothetical protein ABMY35_18420 [Pseudoalteromonas sp. BZB3]